MRVESDQVALSKSGLETETETRSEMSVKGTSDSKYNQCDDLKV